MHDIQHLALAARKVYEATAHYRDQPPYTATLSCWCCWAAGYQRLAERAKLEPGEIQDLFEATWPEAVRFFPNAPTHVDREWLDSEHGKEFRDYRWDSKLGRYRRQEG